MRRIKDLSGKTFGEWTVISFSHLSSQGAIWNCKCSCGNEKLVRGNLLTNGSSKSCHGNKKEITWEVDDNGCWNCTSHKPNTGGYPRGSIGNNKNILINRIVYERYNGEVPKGLYILHRCDNRMCINPEHLFLGTNLDNIRDMNNKGRNKHCFGENSPVAVLTEEQAYEIKYAEGVTHKQLAEKFNISRGEVTAIRAGRRWNHI